MKIGKIELTQERSTRLIIAICVATALGTYLILFAPLMSKVKAERLECRSIESDVLECRNIIESSGKGERVLIAEEDVSYAIDELTRHGKVKGVNFISMNPKKIERKEKDSQYKELPIEMELESTYEELGVFLGSLDDLKKSLVKVKSFDITADEEDTSKLTTDLIAEIYLSGRGHAE